MELEVAQARSWDDYKKAWIHGMKGVHWVKEPRLFDYNVEEELEDLQKGFEKPSNLFLVARAPPNVFAI